jgi:putative ABC transport system permease protein
MTRLAQTWAAVRYRRSQSLVLVIVSALVTTCAVFAPLFVRTLEQGLLQAGLVERDVADTTVVVRAVRTAQDPTVTPDELRAVMPEEATRWFHDGVGMTTADTRVQPRAGMQTSPLRLVARQDSCDHVEMVSGSCPSVPGEVLVSAADAAKWGWSEGTRFEVADPSASPATPSDAVAPVPLTVTGVYRVVPDPNYWLRTVVDGKSGFLIAEGVNNVAAIDDFLTGQETFDTGWAQASASLEFPLDRETVTLTTVPQIRDSLQGLDRVSESVTVASPVPDIVATVVAGRSIVRTLVPLLLAQLALLAVTVLALMAHAAVEQRRPEIALARLRGRSRDGGGRVVKAELSLTVLLGAPLGIALALAVSDLVRRTVMPAGVPFELRWPVGAAAALAVVGSLLAVHAVSRPVLREPVGALLRRVPPQASKGLRLLDVVVVVVAALGVVAVVSGDVEGPTALLTPMLLALAVGLLGAALLRRLAARAGQRALASGRLATGLAALSLARRPALRNVLVVVTAACALATFAANAVLVGSYNRTSRAQLETGAPAVITTDTTSPAALAAAVDGLEEAQRQQATPVVIIRPRDPSAVPTLLARPAELSRIGYAVPTVGIDELTPPVAPSIQLEDGEITGTLTWELDEFRTGDEPVGKAPPSSTGIPGGDLSIDPAPVQIGITVSTPDGEFLDRDLAQVPQSSSGTSQVSAPVLCPQGCRLAGLWVRGTDPWAEHVTGRAVLSALTLGGQPLELGGEDRWLPAQAGPEGGTQELSGAGDELVIDFDTTGRRVFSPVADVPSPMPVILAGDPPADATEDGFTLIGLGGRPVASEAVATAEALPALGARGALADLDAQLKVGGAAPPGSELEVWLGSEDPQVLAAVEGSLTAAGIPVISTTTVEQATARYDASATGWGLLLGVFTGIMALLVAALVVGLVAVTSWRGVARDLAGLVVAGTPRAVVRSAVRREQLVTVVAGVLLGTACGVAGSLLALPLVPLFDRPAAIPAPDLTPAWGVIAATALGALDVVGGVALLAARGIMARAVPERLRESL